MKILAFVTLLCVSSIQVYSSEVDSFLRREILLSDSKSVINAKAAHYIQDALDRANRKNRGCNEKKLYKSLRKNFKNHWLRYLRH